MGFNKLPSNSEQLLLELVQCDNPAELLAARFNRAKQQEDEELRAILHELKNQNYLTIQWADNVPYYVVLHNSARTYRERLAEYQRQHSNITRNAEKCESPVIFISHRTEDAEVADILRDYLVANGIPNEYIFCSSLPGNDVKSIISREVKGKIKNSCANIAILSQGYYKSAYCLNEAGIFWLNDDLIPVIAIGLSEITHSKMYGFLNNDYKLRRLDNENDISDIYDTVRSAVNASQPSMSVFTAAGQKLRQRYSSFLEKRKDVALDTPSIPLLDITTDDERIVLYYILDKHVRKVSKDAIIDWLHTNEIYDVNVENAFDLLSTLAGGNVSKDTLEFGIEAFRKYSANSKEILSDLQPYVDKHTKPAVNTFRSFWDTNSIDELVKLFIAYIVDERMRTFGNRWMKKAQIQSIQQWEGKNSLYASLSNNYGSCLEFFVQNNFVYESDWTSYGNVREYTLCPSLQKFLFDCPPNYLSELQTVLSTYTCSLPF